MKTIIKSSLQYLRTAVVLCLISHANNLKSQDIIIKTDSNRIQSIIQEINQDDITYKLFNYSDGPRITISKTEIAYIKYKNGVIDYFTMPVSQSTSNICDLDKYNMDGDMPTYIPYSEKRNKKCEKLYLHKNYLGVNFLSFLNTSIGFNYMRDFAKEHLIVNVPVAFGLGHPNITDATYRGYLGGQQTNSHYSVMKFQSGLSVLYAPTMNKEVNFLIGPSFLFSSYRIDVNTTFNTSQTYTNINNGYPYTQYVSKKYKNSFNLNRQVYGMSVGFLARFNERINMNALFTLGLKSDTYKDKDPYGFEYIKSQGGTPQEFDYKYNAAPYAQLALSIGYRF